MKTQSAYRKVGSSIVAKRSALDRRQDVIRHRRALLAELVGTASLLAVVIGSGIMNERLSPDNAAVALSANSLATGFALYVLITVIATA